jgi:hypothetical protein
MRRWDDSSHRIAPKADRIRRTMRSMYPGPMCLISVRYRCHFGSVQRGRGGRGPCCTVSLSRCLSGAPVLPETASALSISTVPRCHGYLLRHENRGCGCGRMTPPLDTRQDNEIVSVRLRIRKSGPGFWLHSPRSIASGRIRSLVGWVPSIESWQSPRYA